jgi:predicted kinase
MTEGNQTYMPKYIQLRLFICLLKVGVNMFFVQMSGFPGSGKSTLARQIATNTRAVIIDHDIVKSALLHSIGEISIDAKLAGKISYNIDWSLIEFHLTQGQSVIFDSPCLYEEMVIKGTELAEKYKAKYKYVECYLDDRNEINRRLKDRERMISQIQ